LSHCALPPAAYESGGHVEHTSDAASECFPAAQSVHASGPAPSLDFPAAQYTHSPAVAVMPGAHTHVPFPLETNPSLQTHDGTSMLETSTIVFTGQ